MRYETRYERDEREYTADKINGIIMASLAIIAVLLVTGIIIFG